MDAAPLGNVDAVVHCARGDDRRERHVEGTRGLVRVDDELGAGRDDGDERRYEEDVLTLRDRREFAHDRERGGRDADLFSTSRNAARA